MNDQQVIDWQLQQLEQGLYEPMPQAIQEYVNQHAELAAELETLKQFWQTDTSLPEPSSDMRDRFYHSLSEQQTSATVTKLDTARPATGSGMQQWWLQAAVLAVVFVLGVFTGQTPSQNTGDQALASLQQEVASLSTVMAISMLQNNSASQRLAGVTYTRQANLTDPLLLDTLLETLSKEQSSAVKLAIVDTLGTKSGLSSIENDLIELAVAENQPLVQMALSRLIVEKGSLQARELLMAKLSSLELNKDVNEFLQLINAQNRV